MRGTVAKQIRKEARVNPKEKRKYLKTKEGTIITDENRRNYKKLKKEYYND